MAAGTVWRFGTFWLEVGNEQLWRGEQTLSLKPKALAVLRYLIEHAGQLVTKEALFQAVWPDTVVSEAVLTTCMREIRQVLGDDAKAPQFVETVHRRGYRFIAPLLPSQPVSSSKLQVSSSRPKPTSNPQSPTLSFVGRDAELAQLYSWLERALSGERQIVFVTGEPGIGKTTLVEAFLAQIAADGRVWIGRGQCIEHYGAGEAYLPVLEALGRLCREPGGGHLIEFLGQHAPTWLVQMPALLSATDLETQQRKTHGATRERMLREMAEAVEALTAERPLVLWLEDLQWSDVSTLDWLSSLARRREPARLLLIGTYRPVEVIVSQRPLKAVKQELQLHRQCVELPLGCLSEGEVAKYLAMRFASPSAVPGEGRSEGSSPSPVHGLARLIHQRTDGNPLFMVNVADYLVAREMVVEERGQWKLAVRREEAQAVVPEDIRQLIERQIERLSPEDQRVLEAASVAGAEFSAAAVAAGVGAEVGEVEEQCGKLARRGQFLRISGMSEWPDGTVAARYSFIHALYQEVIYNRMPSGRRQRVHQQIGEREEVAYGERAREIAAELAVHFERGRDYRKGTRYLQHAAENAIRRSAYLEAISHLTKGLELLKLLPDTPERTQQELTLQVALGSLLGMTKGFAAPEVETAYVRARELCQQVEATPQLFWVLFGLCGFYVLRAELQTARGPAEQLLTMAQRTQEPALLGRAHYVLGCVLSSLGELTLALEHLEQGSALYDPQQRHSYRAGPDSRVLCLSHAAFVLWLLGYPDQALKRSHEALTLARELSHSFSLATALNMATVLHQVRREIQAVQEWAEATITPSTEQGFAILLAIGTTLRGWALAEQGQGEEGIAQMRQGLVAYRATGTEVHRPYFLALLAEVYRKAGQIEEGLNALAEALATVHKTGERYYEAELYRLKGTLTLQSKTSRKQVTGKSKASRDKSEDTDPQAEACFLKAIEIARRQSAKSLELRATVSLARLWQNQGKKEEARQMLAEIYGWSTEGFDTADLKEARELLVELKR
jgi:DNA-binding winged helix-turn-helix (wHTH) protein/predicted ATPase